MLDNMILGQFVDCLASPIFEFLQLIHSQFQQSNDPLSFPLGVPRDGPKQTPDAMDVMSVKGFDKSYERSGHLPFRLPEHLLDVVEGLTKSVGTDAMLRSKLLQWSSTGDALELNPMLKVGRLWVHSNHERQIYQLSSEHGPLRHGKSAGLYVLDLDQLRQTRPPFQTLSITFGPYEASALNLLGLRAVAILFPKAWTPQLFEHFMVLLKTERLSQVVFWPYKLGAAWNFAPEEMDWLGRFQALAARNGIQLNVMSMDGHTDSFLPEDARLQALLNAFIGTLAPDGEDHPATREFQDGVVDALVHALSYTHWHEQLPALLRRPSHWHELGHASLPNLKRAQSQGTSYLLSARVRSVDSTDLVPQRVEWSCPEARGERSDCWACSEAARRGAPCSIAIPSEFLTDLAFNQDAKRIEKLEESLRKAARCPNNPVLRFLDPQPLRKCQVVESLPFIERVPEAETLLVKNDQPLLAGKEYEFEIRCVRSRYSGRLVLVAEDFHPCLSAVERFRPHGPDLAQLDVFRIGLEDGPEKVAAVIDAQVSALFEKLQLRRTESLWRMVRWFWLLYATPYCIPKIGGIHRGGAASIFIIGDTSLGKSYSLEQLTEFLQMGRKADSKATSATGLLAVPNGDRVVPGEIPELDRELLVISEAHALNPAIWQDLRDARRDGIYVYRKLASGSFRTRTRMAFVANPADPRKTMSDYARPWDAAPYLRGPDIARFDVFLTLTRDPQGKMAQQASPFAAETLRRLVAHNWSKECHEPQVWSVTPEALDLVRETAAQLRANFGMEAFPLLSGEQVEGLLLSWATAASNLALLAVGPRMVVGPAHVEYVRNLLIENAKGLGMQPLSTGAVAADASTLPTEDLIREIRAKAAYLGVAMAFIGTTQLSLEQLASRTKKNAETLRKNVVPWFRERGLLVSKQGKGGGLMPTELLKEVLSRIPA